jgi:transcriptional regulator GlxA family with amidase domain
LLADEIVEDEPGQEAVLDRLLDLLLIAILRAWFARPDAATPAWYRAHADPIVGHALSLMHHNPSHPWTLAELAHECGSTRAAFARRFNDLVGEPPMTFLTGWRITLAADLLREPGATIGSVAAQVGYSSPSRSVPPLTATRHQPPATPRNCPRRLTGTAHGAVAPAEVADNPVRPETHFFSPLMQAAAQS